MTGALLALAYPDRIGRRRAATANRYLLSGGRGAVLPEGDPMSNEEFLVVAETDGASQDARIFLAAPIGVAEIEELYEDRIVDEQVVQWNARDNSVLARRRRRLGALLIEDKPLARPDPEKVKAAMLDGIRQRGLPWTDELRDWRQRIAFLRGIDESWPDLSDKACSPRSTIGWRRSSTARRSASISPPRSRRWCRGTGSGRSTRWRRPISRCRAARGLPIDYANPAEPTLSVRLQEMFGLTDTPKVGGGKVPVLIHLLSPARRPVQVTRDLASFWTSGYKAVKAELKGRYPRHYWPDDPLVAEPTARVKRRPTPSR